MIISFGEKSNVEMLAVMVRISDAFVLSFWGLLLGVHFSFCFLFLDVWVRTSIFSLFLFAFVCKGGVVSATSPFPRKFNFKEEA